MRVEWLHEVERGAGAFGMSMVLLSSRVSHVLCKKPLLLPTMQAARSISPCGLHVGVALHWWDTCASSLFILPMNMLEGGQAHVCCCIVRLDVCLPSWPLATWWKRSHGAQLCALLLINRGEAVHDNIVICRI